MDLAKLSIKRPIFITCIILFTLALGYLSLNKLPVDIFPDVNFPIVVATISYPGAGPAEVETQISKVVEEEVQSLPGIKRLTSSSKEGLSTIVAEFSLKTDIKYAEQLVRDRVSGVKYKLPRDAKEPIIRRIDPADQPILMVSLTANLPPAKLYQLANDVIKPRFEQIDHVGLVKIVGGRKREIWVELDRNKLKAHELSATQVSDALARSGENVPAGHVDRQKTQTVIRTLGEFKTLRDISDTVVNFFGSDVPIKISELGSVKDTLEEEQTKGYVNGKPALMFMIYKQSGANTIAVVDHLNKELEKISKSIQTQDGAPKIVMVRDGAQHIRANVEDVMESILIGIALTILVVFVFLGNARSTFITAMALPNSLLGAFLLMSVAGFSINVMSLLALSLSVGLLVDDAIVVRENIFRHLQMGKTTFQAAIEGTQEVRLAVIATTLTVIAVFGPIAFLQGIVGQFFKEFGLTICFAMLISLFDALTIAPMLSAYFAGRVKHEESSRGWHRIENLYGKVLSFTLANPLKIMSVAVLIFALSIVAVSKVPKTFLPAQDIGEFAVSLELPQGTPLETTRQLAQTVDGIVRAYPQVRLSALTVGTSDGESNVANLIVELVSAKKRKENSSEFKAIIRERLKPFAYAKPAVKDIDFVGGGERPFNLVIVGNDLQELEKTADRVVHKIKNHPALLDVEVSSKKGKPELQIDLDPEKAKRLGIAPSAVGLELRTQVQGSTPAIFREEGTEYDIRVRLQENQRDIAGQFGATYVPNVNHNLVRLSDIAKPFATTGPANINRQNRGRYVLISADIAPSGPGIGGAISDIKKLMAQPGMLPAGMSYDFLGQAENFKELGINMSIAAGLGILFIFFVLASLYESFVTPFTIMLVLPLAACGAFYALLVTGKSLDIFSMIGCIMLLGIATKNSILLVDYTQQLIKEGKPQREALLQAGKTRLRPILMTTFALIAGMLPVAIGLNEASRQRTSMGVAIIGGLITSTLLTLVVVPAAYGYLERFRQFALRISKDLTGN